jgi:hypothetical protein
MKPFDQGKKGFMTDTVNPYKEGTYNYKEWERGYDQGYYENLSGRRGQEVHTKKEAKEVVPFDFS